MSFNTVYKEWECAEMKRLVTLVLCFVMLFSFVACTNDTAQQSDIAEVITVTDHGGYEVEIPADAKRVVVCDILPLSSVLAVFFDSAENIVGMSDTAMVAAENGLLGELYPEILNAKTDFIKGTEVNVEELMKLNPDVVFYSASSKQLGEQLRNAGFAAVGISVNNWEYDCIETLNQWIGLLSEIFPANDKGELVREYSEDIYRLVQERVKDIPQEERERIFFLFKYTDSAIMTSGKSFFGQWWADAVGAVNVAEEMTADNSVTINMEQVYAWNPAQIYITNFTTAMPEDLYENSFGNYDWSGIDGVKAKRVEKMPLGMYRSYTPGVDTPITLLWLAKEVYPERFADIDLTEETISYYQEVFGVTLTKEQAEGIFTPSAQAGAGF